MFSSGPRVWRTNSSASSRVVEARNRRPAPSSSAASTCAAPRGRTSAGSVRPGGLAVGAPVPGEPLNTEDSPAIAAYRPGACRALLDARSRRPRQRRPRRVRAGSTSATPSGTAVPTAVVCRPATGAVARGRDRSTAPVGGGQQADDLAGHRRAAPETRPGAAAFRRRRRPRSGRGRASRSVCVMFSLARRQAEISSAMIVAARRATCASNAVSRVPRSMRMSRPHSSPPTATGLMSRRWRNPAPRNGPMTLVVPGRSPEPAPRRSAGIAQCSGSSSAGSPLSPGGLTGADAPAVRAVDRARLGRERSDAVGDLVEIGAVEHELGEPVLGNRGAPERSVLPRDPSRPSCAACSSRARWRSRSPRGSRTRAAT